MRVANDFPAPISLPVDIDDLARHSHLLPALALCHQRQWQRNGRTTDLQHRLEKLRSHLSGQRLPRTWLALIGKARVDGEWVGGPLAGSVSLVRYEARGAVGGKMLQAGSLRESAWLANLYVVPVLRGRGVGQVLLEHAEREAARRGYSQLLLFTPDRQDYYRRRRWQWCRRVRVQGQWVDILRRDLAIYRAPVERGRQAPGFGHITLKGC